MQIHNTEDRAWWYEFGMEKEIQFVSLCKNKLNIDAKINPEKETNKYAPDLIVDDVVSDLKTQTTPFFSSGKYGIDPQFSVTFNHKDYIRYSEMYENINIYFWLMFNKTNTQWGSVESFSGIFMLPFLEIVKFVNSGAPRHFYQKRKDPNDRNAKSSYIFDICKFKPIFLKTDGFSCLFKYPRKITSV